MQQQNRANLLFSNITSGQFSSRFWIRCYLDSSIVLVHITKLHVDQCHAFQYILITIWIMPRYILFPPFIIFCLIFLMTKSKLLLSNSNACMRKSWEGKESPRSTIIDILIHCNPVYFTEIFHINRNICNIVWCRLHACNRRTVISLYIAYSKSFRRSSWMCALCMQIYVEWTGAWRSDEVMYSLNEITADRFAIGKLVELHCS